MHDFHLFQTDANSENLTHIREPVDKGLELVFTVCNKGSIISEEKVAQCYIANFGFCSKACRVEEFPPDRVRNRMPSSVDLNACFRRTERKMLKSVGANTQPCFTPLFMCLRQASIILYSASCPIMK